VQIVAADFRNICPCNNHRQTYLSEFANNFLQRAPNGNKAEIQTANEAILSTFGEGYKIPVQKKKKKNYRRGGPKCSREPKVTT
jgi:hypothetical protein